jgi:hypothetical protein
MAERKSTELAKDTGRAFTREEGIAIQAAHLAEWKLVLQPRVFAKLKGWAMDGNPAARWGDDVIRGDDLTRAVRHLAQGEALVHGEYP